MISLVLASALFLQAENGTVVDKSGSIPSNEIKSGGIEFVQDDEAGEVMRFTGEKAEIRVPDNGRLDITNGITIEAEIFLEKPAGKDGFGFARKSVNPSWGECPFSLSFNGNRLRLDHLHFRGEKIDWAEFEGMHQWKLKPDSTYPGAGNTMNGLYDIVTGRWTHVSFTYNPKRGYLATAIDHGIDREAFNPHHGIFDELADDNDAPVRLFLGANNIRVKSIRISDKPDLDLYGGVARAFVTENAYRGTSYVHIKPVRDDIPLPVDITVENVSPPYRSPIAKYTMMDLEPHNYDIPKWQFSNVGTELVVRMIKDGREIWHYETLLCNPSAASPASWRMMRLDPPRKDGKSPKHPDWWIENDNTITFKGKPVLPLMISHVKTNDFDTVVDLGFNMIGITLENKTFDRNRVSVMDEYCRKAAERGVTIEVESNKLDREGEGFLYAFDEPWGHSFAKMYAKFRNLRSARTRPAELIITGGQNNWQRYRETGCVTDMLAVDPYWRGRSPLRSIYDAVQYAIRDTDGLKPVTLDIGCYGPLEARPNYDELRTQSYLGLIAGARALYYYTWDDGPESNTATMPEIQANYKRLFEEFKRFDGVLALPNADHGPVTEPAMPRGFFMSVKKDYLFAVSDLYKPETRKIVYKPFAGKKIVLFAGPDLGEVSKEIVFDDEGKADLLLPPLGCAVYKVIAP